MSRGKYERPRTKRNNHPKGLIITICVLVAILISCCITIVYLETKTNVEQPTPSLPHTTEIITEPTTSITEPPAPTEEPTPTEPYIVSTASLGATGDVLMHKGVINAGKVGTNTYNYDELFKYISEYYSSYDIMVANMEGTLSGGNSDSDYVGYPQFNAPDGIATSLSNAGIDILLTSNNHSYDYGNHGLSRTQEVISENNMEFLGTQATIEDNDYIIKDVNDIKIGMLAYTYETGKVGDNKTLNGLTVASNDTYRISSFDYENLPEFYKEIETNIACMKDLGAEAIVVFMHWGDEYSLTPNSNQEAIAAKLNTFGVDVIIGGHPHVIQPFNKNARNSPTSNA